MHATLIPGLDGPEPDARPVVVGVGGRTYRLGPSPLGRGAQAEVWPAQRDDGTPVAVKVSWPGAGSARAVLAEANVLEALAAQRVGGVVGFLDRGSFEGRPVLVMPRLWGEADAWLRERLEERPEEGLHAVLALAAGIARALAGLHRAELPEGGKPVHRDVKPENLLVDAEGRPVLADLGGLLLTDGTGPRELGVFGSPLWAPLDQMLPGLPDPNPTWDTYALCALLFWWLTGGRPSWQSDPRPMLTPRGRDIWGALCGLAAAEGPEAREAAARALTAARSGTRAPELLEVRHKGAIQAADRAAIAEGVDRLAPAAEPATRRQLVHALTDLLARGLSPLAHPSPPNRWWDAGELAEELDALAARVAPRPAAPVPARPWMWVAAAGAGLATVVVAAVATFAVWAVGAAEADGAAAATVTVEGGPFLAGDVWGVGQPDERPVRQVDVVGFRIDRTEVSNGMYRSCVAFGACTRLGWLDERDEVVDATYLGLAQPDQPAVGVTWPQAASYCAWVGGRLPTEDEWEMAATWRPGARNPEQKRRWPWGDAAPDCRRANARGCGVGHSLPVGSLPEGASAWGALDLAGNVWEWTASEYRVTRKDFFRRVVEVHRVLRGGAWTSTDAALRPTFRRHVHPDTASDVHGFRCVYPMEGHVRVAVPARDAMAAGGPTARGTSAAWSARR